MVLDQSKIFFLSSCGTPSSSAIACSGSSLATSATKSPVPSETAVATIRSARSLSTSRRLPIARGVKPREMMLRSLVCCGGSILSMISRCIARLSSVCSSPSLMIAVFSQLPNRSLFLEISTTSACLVTTQ